MYAIKADTINVCSKRCMGRMNKKLKYKCCELEEGSENTKPKMSSDICRVRIKFKWRGMIETNKENEENEDREKKWDGKDEKK